MTNRNTFLDTKTAKIYDDNTVIGNWFENRAVIRKAQEPPQKTQEHNYSEYAESYAKPVTAEELTQIFTSSYVQGFRNRARAHHSSVKFFNANQFLTNLCSTHDVYFRIKTGRNRCGKLVKPPMATEDFDPLKSYGNATKFGLRQYIRDREEQLRNIPTDISFTRDFFKCPHKGDYAKIVKKKR